MRTEWDIIVAGAGPGGLACALELKRRGFSVLVCAGRTPGPPAPGETIPEAARETLNRLGLLTSMESDRSVAFQSRDRAQYWGNPSPLTAHEAASPSWHIDRQKVGAALLSLARAVGVEFLHEATVLRFSPDDPACRVQIRLSSGKVVTCSAGFLVDATGRKSLSAKTTGLSRVSHNRLIAIRSQWKDSSGEGPDLLIETHPLGWACAVRLPGQRMVAAVFGDADLLPRPFHKLGRLDQLHSLFPRMAKLLENGDMLTPPVALPAHDSQAARIMGARWIAVGDAAATFDPLATCGLQFAFGSAIHAAAAVEESLGGEFEKARCRYATELAWFAGRVRGRLHETYAAERRWADSSFWRRRHSGWFESGHRLPLRNMPELFQPRKSAASRGKSGIEPLLQP